MFIPEEALDDAIRRLHDYDRRYRHAQFMGTAENLSKRKPAKIT